MDIPFLSDTIAMRITLHEVAAKGAIHIPSVLPEGFRICLQRELEAGSFQPAAPSGQVSQEFEFYSLPFPTPTPTLVGNLGQQLTKSVQSGTHHYRLWWWQPNDIAVQRYLPNHGGIERHRDYKCDVLLVAVFTISGAASFRVWEGPDICDEWLTRAGDLVLLRAPGMTVAEDDRLYHSIGKPLHGSRISLAYRLNNRLPTTVPLPR